jgi:hypothetical protein
MHDLIPLAVDGTELFKERVAEEVVLSSQILLKKPLHDFVASVCTMNPKENNAGG